VNKPNKDRRAELDLQWEKFKKQADEFISTTIPGYNKKLWAAGIGAVQIKK
jgi:hypothetical protein